jgi:hypothetical protein
MVLVPRVLAPHAVRNRLQAGRHNRESSRWFIWFKQGTVKLAIDVHTDDMDAGRFRIRLTSQTRRWIGYREADTPQLDELRLLVESELRKWSAADIKTEQD